MNTAIAKYVTGATLDARSNFWYLGLDAHVRELLRDVLGTYAAYNRIH
jgi:hypothetical protein